MLQKELKNRIRIVLDVIVIILGITTTIAAVLIAGFYIPDGWNDLLFKIVQIVVVAFAVQEFIRWFIAPQFFAHLRTRWFELFLALSFIINNLLSNPLLWLVQNVFIDVSPNTIIIIYLIIVQLAIMSAIIVKSMRYNSLISKIKLHPGALFSLSFAVIILMGSLMLMMPKAVEPGMTFSYLDALFTSTSAVCVTGLIVVDTATHFTLLGKIIILFLIQVGGIGVMTITTFFAMFFAGGLSIRMRIVMNDLFSSDSISEVTGLLKRIVLFVFLIELFGALLLYLSFGGNYLPISREYVFDSVFHSISAFCNAGFSLNSNSLMSQLIISNFWYQTTIMILILLGGIGFPVLQDLFIKTFRKRRQRRWFNSLSFNSKIVLLSTLVLIVFGAFFIYLNELHSNNIGDSAWERLFNSVFQSVTARTAGFNTVDITALVPGAALIMIFLMWIGASPNSTGGGIKTSTFSISLFYLINYIRGKQILNLFKKEVSMESIRKAFMIIFSSVIMLFIFTSVLIVIEPDKDALDLLFETASAISTVGLSRDITMHLGTGGKWLILILMFIGRIGVLTFLLSFVRIRQEGKYSYPKQIINF